MQNGWVYDLDLRSFLCKKLLQDGEVHGSEIASQKKYPGAKWLAVQHLWSCSLPKRKLHPHETIHLLVRFAQDSTRCEPKRHAKIDANADLHQWSFEWLPIKMGLLIFSDVRVQPCSPLPVL